MTDISMREMLEAGVHFGHQTRYWNPKMAAYLYGHRNKIHIIDLEKTKVMFQDALNFAGKLSANKGTILFVGTKRAAQQIIKEEAQRCGMPYINLRWLGGLLTNYKTVKQSINRLRELEEMKTNGGMERMSKKEALHHQRELEKLERNLAGIKDMDGWPDALFVVDVGFEDIAVSEAVKLKIPVIGVVDSNNSPDGIDYVIPGNDDAIRSIRLYTKAIADAIITGKDSVAHLGDAGGDKDEFVELDAEGAPIVEARRDKVQVKRKPARKTARKTEPRKTDGAAEVEVATEAAAKVETAAEVATVAEVEGAANQEAQPEAAHPEAAQPDEAQPEAVQPRPAAEESARQPVVEAAQDGAEQSETELDEMIYQFVRQVPAGRVDTYGQVADLVGLGPRKAQRIGQALGRLPDVLKNTDVPWHRIVYSSGEIIKEDMKERREEQRRRLLEEGVTFSSEGKVDLKLCQHNREVTTDTTGVAEKQDATSTEETV